MSRYVYGKICPKHPEVHGRRFSNRTCVVCSSEQSSATAKQRKAALARVEALESVLRDLRREMEPWNGPTVERWRAMIDSVNVGTE